jgi:isopentenyl diphosphate isomerase/L-lactate dehydrogenase-like FMN-dependent dehydrogenase
MFYFDANNISLGTVSIEEISTIRTPKLFQLYFHKDRGLTNSMIECRYVESIDIFVTDRS